MPNKCTGGVNGTPSSLRALCQSLLRRLGRLGGKLGSSDARVGAEDSWVSGSQDGARTEHPQPCCGLFIATTRRKLGGVAWPESDRPSLASA